MNKASRVNTATTAATHQLGAEGLARQWSKLHLGDREPYPDDPYVKRLAKHYPVFGSWVAAHGGAGKVASGVQGAWRDFHEGNFSRAITAGAKLGALGAIAANKATAIQTLNEGCNKARSLKLLEAAIERGERALEELPDYPNAHYMLALVLGRYSQGISILKALADGLATRVRHHLEDTLKLEPRHAEAHIAMGLYHAEIVGKLGSLLAGVTYEASGQAAAEHFQRALKLAPHSPIAHIEYANGLMRLDPTANREQASKLYGQAAATDPADAMERLDVERAQRGLE
jgi:tetratricopeptide (TPR) repeat protein